MSNRYIEKVASWDKEANLAIAGAAHLLQNAATNIAVRSKRFANYLAKPASGKFGDKVKAVISGASVPELEMFRDGVSHARQYVVNATAGQTPYQAKKVLVGARMAAQGRFGNMVKYDLHKHPVVREAINKVNPVGNRVLDYLDTFKHHPAFNELTADVHKVWSSKSNPIISNVLHNISKSMDAGVGLHRTKHYAMGNAALALADPITASMNAAKTLVTSPLAQKSKLVGKLKDMMITHPAETAFNQGVDGKKLSRLANLGRTHLINPVSGHLQRLGGDLGSTINNWSTKYIPAEYLEGLKHAAGNVDVKSLKDKLKDKF